MDVNQSSRWRLSSWAASRYSQRESPAGLRSGRVKFSVLQLPAQQLTADEVMLQQWTQHAGCAPGRIWS